LNNEARLRAELESIPFPQGTERHICIPIEEVEAWFFSDPKILKKYGAAGKATASPHSVRRPKETLRALSKWENKKPRYSTNENPRLAAELDLDLCAKRCPAFRAFRTFVAAG